MRPTVLVVDDERLFRVLAEEALSSEGFEVRTASTLQRARIEIDKATPDVMILDRRLPDGDGIDMLRELNAQGQTASLVIVVTAYGDVENAVEALRAGAVDYLTKPLQVTDLVVKLRKVLEARGLRDRLALAASSSDAQRPRVAPKSPAAQNVFLQLERVSQSPLTPVFLVGPSGAGKQHAAELLHRMTFPSLLGDGTPFVEVNCAALPAHLVESELFGHERGAFTDAKTMRRGLIEMADGGTLFLDEITELPEPSQAKLLKFLDSMRFRRLGGQREIEVSLRIVAATNRDLKTLDNSRFREDLYHRLAVFLVNIPPLADRKEDISELAKGFVSYFAGRVKKRITGINAEALEALSTYNFPGNVRELRNIIERAMILTAGPEIEARDIILPELGELRGKGKARVEDSFFSMALGVDGVPPPAEVVERAYVARVLEHFHGKRVVAAQALGISYPTFLKRLRELGFASDS
jgi:two-component system response regulator AtoC